MVRVLPSPSEAPGVPGRPVRLTLVAPYFQDTILPTLTGRLAAALPGYFGVLRYLVELDVPLPRDFDPLGELPWFARGRRVPYLLVTPAPEAPTLQTPPDVIGQTIARGGVVHVFVSVGPGRHALRADARRVIDERRCPFLCMADLEALPDPAPAADRPR